MRFSVFIALLAGAAAAQRSTKPTAANGVYTINGTAYKNRAYFDFSGLKDNTSIPKGLIVSGYKVANTHKYDTTNTYIQGGYLNLRVNGGQKVKPYKCAEVVTSVQNIKYASVRTVGVLAEAPGVCNGMFFYKNDNQESDIEWLSDPATQSNTGLGSTRKIWFANQDNDGDGQKTWTAVGAPANPTTTEHEYRIDWVAAAGGQPAMVKFFIDGVESWRTTKDVPTVAGPWVFNNWANGDKGWSCGPPAVDAIFKIKEIDIYYNTA
ncbi:hypothetical protein CGCF415_v012355 [Colletotrichum fructicola]|uniref:Glycoside hydrolase family 16 protein n=1 Tax=Colletotrichum fructicola (strain Nara gc5) TaxID=1213859 RepID=L2FSF3_COLFN|nr:uncharacterized protein CGMCC3_g1610 [Colletotrichum fructicola]KAF4485207.1 hypothetical protein CGGC5_v008340 [Colletotrichum fructicola Nara gc5]KAI8288376.1 hypothetical protein K4K60_011168 [Colletotrichum sp. SAR11_57]KAE9582433.1 hypothetical protein CGMCC3_g1610 [Colletotrichum fructicola]KAF4431218.1 hypothetical protein CFRS1_v008775 [Colletotrichum fructicola]KAF4887217.1 hypothetical protein CGCFRS4_v010629 [Colletotrichum fructicola]